MANHCNICTRKVLSHAKNVICKLCKNKYHCKCISINTNEISSILNANEWYCMLCLSDALPFINIEDDIDYIEALNHKDHFEICWDIVDDKIFNPFTLTDDERGILQLDEIDPDENYYNDLMCHSSTLCKYYLQDDFNKELLSYVADPSNSFSLCHFNIRSLQENFTSMQSYLDSLDLNFTFLGVTETWNTDRNFDLFNLPNYNFVEKHRSTRQGGGVGLFLPDNVDYLNRNDLDIFDDTLESMFIEVSVFSSPKNIIIGVVYRPPGRSLKDFNDIFCDILGRIKSERKMCYLLGDWNCNLLSYESHLQTKNMVDMFYSYGFVPLINRPTRISSTSATIIDNIFTNNHTDLINSFHGLLLTDISDHLPIFHITKDTLENNKDLEIIKRSFSQKNKQSFLSELSTMTWDSVITTENAQDAFTIFHKTFTSVFEKNFPKRKVKLKYESKKSWLTDSLKNCIKRKNHLYYKSIKVKTAYNELMYTTYRNKLKKVLFKAEQEHYSQLLEANKSNMKKTWTILKQIINKKKYSKTQAQFKLNDDTLISDKSVISEKFNDFFIDVGPNLAKKIPVQTITPEQYLKNQIQSSIFLETVTAKELTDIVNNLRKCSAGYDEINKDILDISLPFIQGTLLYLLNQSLLQGIFPDELKIANVTPIFKADDSAKFNNYRPVSVLSTLSKIFERVMYNRLIDFLETHKILYEKQFGFRKQHSTYMALMILIDKLIKCMENGEIVIGVFLDFSKAFDTVDHSILLSKLNHYGIRGIAHNWFESYLCNRKQFVTYNGVQSTMKTIKCGVPQGSILGPLLFLIYINDLVNICNHTAPFLFADDTNLFKHGTDLNDIVESLNLELNEISLWLKVNKLSLNIKKTHYMVFTTRRITIDVLDIKIDGYMIDRVTHTKFLGVFIDEKLNWKKHISYISGKISRGLGIIVKARKKLPLNALKTLYFSFIYPFFTYCNHVWGSTCVTNLEPLFFITEEMYTNYKLS